MRSSRSASCANTRSALLHTSPNTSTTFRRIAMAQTIPAAKDLPPIEPAPEKISGGHLVAKALKNEGVDAIFTLCGGHIIDIYDGCIDEGIRIIDVRHEQVAAHAA